MEAVVKSLDPNSTSDRDLVLDSATEIIGYVVKTYVITFPTTKGFSLPYITVTLRWTSTCLLRDLLLEQMKAL